MRVSGDIEWLEIYYVRGALPKGYRLRNGVSDPPCAGWQHALVMRGEKRSTILCPYSLQAYVVRNDSSEMTGAREPRSPFDPGFVEDLMRRKWEQFQRYGWQRDYDTCALFMTKLGWEVPAQVQTGGGEDTRKKGGKETSTRLLKPVKASGKRGKFLKWFLEGGSSRSVREAMAEFSMTRSNALSYLYMLQKDHGIGYELVGDMATVSLPDGCTDPFYEQAAPRTTADAPGEIGADNAVPDDSDAWLGDGDDAWLN